MADLDREEVRRIARLARLRFEDPEVERLAAEMRAILGHFEALEAAGARGAPQIQERGLADRNREDEVACDPLRLGAEENAPDWRDGFFVVPSLSALTDTGEEA